MLKASSKHSHPQTSNVSRAPAAAAATTAGATTSVAVATSVAATTQLTALVRKTGLTNPCWQIDSKSTQRAHRGQNTTSMHKNVPAIAGTTT